MRKIGKKLLAFVVALAVVFSCAPMQAAFAGPAKAEKKPLKLQFDFEAQNDAGRNGWRRETSPIGNGHMGAVIFGRTDTERLQLNEKTLWTGGLGGTDAEPGGEYEKRDAASDAFGNIDAAQSGAMDKYIDKLFDDLYGNSTNANNPAQSGEMKILPNNRSALGDYQNFAEMNIDFNHTGRTGYRRELDLRTALSTVEYDYSGAHYTRTMFANYPSNVMVYQVTADKDGAVDLVLRPTIPNLGISSGAQSKKVNKTGTVTADGDASSILMEGTLENNGMKFAGLFQVVAQGGTVSAQQPTDSTGQLTVSDADSVTIYVALATNYKNEFPDYRENDADFAKNDVTRRIAHAVQMGRDKLYEEHLKDYQEIFGRVELDLGGTYDPAQTTKALKAEWGTKVDSGTQNRYMDELYYQYGRYLLIASSREGSLPANLQGVWNDRAFPDWQSDYHTNINLEMNYWPAFSTNMAETAGPLVEYVDSLRAPGRLTAQKLFGTTGDAWMVNCSANALGFTGNINSNASLTSTGAAFILNNVYDYYKYTEDKEYLASTIYPMMRQSVDFYLQTLQNGRTEDDKDKLYVVPSMSSEHGPWTVGTTYDQALVYMLFQDTIEAIKALGLEQSEQDYIRRLEKAMFDLHPLTIGEDGQIKEWQQEGKYNRYSFDSSKKIGDDVHRHNSQLLMLHPGNGITTETPELMNAAKTTLNKRGDSATGWSMGQKLNMWARLQDGNRAYNGLFKNLIKSNTFDNLWDMHAPDYFQIDGNFGATAGMTEFLLQSHAGYVSLLPALPDAWASGSVSGLKARGNFEVDLKWADKKVVEALITSGSGGRLSLKAGVVDSIIDVTANSAVTKTTQEANGAVSFDTQKGHTYRVVPYNGAEISLAEAQSAADAAEQLGVFADAYETQGADEFEEAYLAVWRMVEQKNYMAGNVGAVVKRLQDAAAALEPRGADEYAAVLALEYAQRMAGENYATGKPNENKWRQEVEPLRGALEETLRAGGADKAALELDALSLAQAVTDVDGTSTENRMKLYDLIVQAAHVERGEAGDQKWTEFGEAIEAARAVFLSRSAADADITAQIGALKAAVEDFNKIYEITAEAGSNGKIAPSGKVPLISGGDKLFSITPDEGFEVFDVLVDGVSVGAVKKYEIKNISADMEIRAEFIRKQVNASEQAALLDLALERAAALNEEDYSADTWAKMNAALLAAKGADRTDEDDMQAKASALLSAMDALTMLQSQRYEAEDGLFPVDGWKSTAAGGVWTNQDNWGDKPITETANPIGGYPAEGPNWENKKLSATGAYGQWATDSHASMSGGMQAITKTKLAWIKFAFTGSRVAYVAQTAMDGALVDVYIDGERVLANLNTSGGDVKNKVLFDSDSNTRAKELLKDGGAHEIKVVCVDKASTAAKPTRDHPIFRVDAFDVYRNKATVQRSGLAEEIAKAAVLTATKYTADSWAAVETALANAEEAFASADADQARIDSSKNALSAAVKKLKEDVSPITEVAAQMPVAVDYKTPAAQVKAKLPATVAVSAGEKKLRVDVTWDMSGYDPDKAGEQVLSGTLNIPAGQGVTNSGNKKASVAVVVAKGTAAITLGNLKQTAGSVSAVTAETVPQGLKVSVLYDGSAAVPQTAGSYPVTAEIDDPNYEGTAKGVLVVQEKPAEPDPGNPDPDPGNPDAGPSVTIRPPVSPETNLIDKEHALVEIEKVSNQGTFVIEVIRNGQKTAAIGPEVFARARELAAEGRLGKVQVSVVDEKTEKVIWTITFEGAKIPDQWTGALKTGISYEMDDAFARRMDALLGKGAKKLRIALEHEGAFPGPATLLLDVSEKGFAAGEKLNLYYYNPQKKALEFVTALTIGADMKAEFVLEHASEYVLTDATVIQDGAAGARPGVKTGDDRDVMLWLVLAAAAACGAAMSLLILRRKGRMAK